MTTYRGAYLSTGDHNGFYTLHLVRAAPNFFKDSFIKNMGRDWNEVHAKYARYCQLVEAVAETSYDSQWDLNEWGSGGTTDWSISQFMNWKACFAIGEMPFGKHRGKSLSNLPWDYRVWLRKAAAEKIADGNKFVVRSWQLVFDALMPFQDADEILDRESETLRDVRAEAEILRKAASQHIGSEGDKLTLNLKCVGRFTSQFANYVISKLVDEAGNSFTTFGVCPLDKGGEFTPIKFTVKRHSEYKGEKQTVINRLKVVG